MKKAILLLMPIMAGWSMLAQRHHDFRFPYETSIQTLQFKVLDINFEKGFIAFKHIYEMQESFIMGDEGEMIYKPVDCKYAGMESYPRAGVVLGIYDLAKGEYTKTFTVYGSCYEIEDCDSHDQSVLKLDSAKQMFKDYGLMIDKNPKGIPFIKQSQDISSLTLDDFEIKSTFQNDYDNMQTISLLEVNGKNIFTETFDDFFVMASRGEVLHTAAYRNGDKIVFLSKFFHTNNMEGPRSWEFFQFSPVFVINGGKFDLEK